MNKSHRVEVANGPEEFFYKLETLKTQGFFEHEIHILSKDMSAYENFKTGSDINTREAGNWMDKFKAFFTGDDAVTEALRGLDLTESEITYLSDELSRGATVIYAAKDTTPGITPFDDTIGQQSEYELEQQADQEARSQLDEMDIMRRRM